MQGDLPGILDCGQQRESKKLADAARHWAAQGNARSEKAKHLREAGIAESDLAEYLGECESFDVHPDNREAVEWFISLQRRWIVSEMGGAYLRFDDAAIAAQMDMRGIKKKRREKLLGQLMLMESAALEMLNKKP